MSLSTTNLGRLILFISFIVLVSSCDELENLPEQTYCETHCADSISVRFLAGQTIEVRKRERKKR